MKTDDDKNFESFLKQNKPFAPSMSRADKFALFDHILHKENKKKPLKSRPDMFFRVAGNPVISIAASFVFVFGAVLFVYFSGVDVYLFEPQGQLSVESLKSVDDAQNIESFLIESFEFLENESDLTVEAVEFESDYVAYFLQ